MKSHFKKRNEISFLWNESHSKKVKPYRSFAKYCRYISGVCVCVYIYIYIYIYIYNNMYYYLQVLCRIRNNSETKVLLAWERKHSSINCNWICNQHRRLQVGRIHRHHNPARYTLLFNCENTDTFSDTSVSNIFAVDAEARVLPGRLS